VDLSSVSIENKFNLSDSVKKSRTGVVDSRIQVQLEEDGAVTQNRSDNGNLCSTYVAYVPPGVAWLNSSLFIYFLYANLGKT